MNVVKNQKIIKILSALIVVFLLLGLCFMLKNKSRGGKNLYSLYEPDRPIIIKENNLYGYISTDGDVLIEPMYYNAYDFHNDYAMVLYDYDNRVYQIIDKKGNVKIETENQGSMEYVEDYDVWLIDENLYSGNLKQITRDISVEYLYGKYFSYCSEYDDESGVIDYKGNLIYKINGDYNIEILDDINDEEELYLYIYSYKKSEKSIVSLNTGKTLFTIGSHIYSDGNNLFYYYDSNNNKVYLFIRDNKLVYKSNEKVYDVDVYDYDKQILRIDYGYDYESLGKTSRVIYYDAKNSKILESNPESVSVDLSDIFNEKLYGYKITKKDYKYGILKNDKLVVPIEYDDITYIEPIIYNYLKSKGKEYFLLEKEKTTYLYDLEKNKNIYVFNTKYVYDYPESAFLLAYVGNNEYLVYSLITGKTLKISGDDVVEYGSNYIKITKDNKNIYYNLDLKEIYRTESEGE